MLAIVWNPIHTRLDIWRAHQRTSTIYFQLRKGYKIKLCPCMLWHYENNFTRALRYNVLRSVTHAWDKLCVTSLDGIHSFILSYILKMKSRVFNVSTCSKLASYINRMSNWGASATTEWLLNQYLNGFLCNRCVSANERVGYT